MISQLRGELRLASVDRHDYDALRRLELEGRFAPTWRFGGVHVSPEAYPSALWTGASHNFLVRRGSNPAILALMTSYNLSERDGHVYFAVARFNDEPIAGILTMLGIGVMFDVLFSSLPVDKVYAEVLEDNLPQFSSFTSSLFVREGILVRHRWASGRRQDVHIFALYADRWKNYSIERLLSEQS
jgi:hypothetical protein